MTSALDVMGFVQDWQGRSVPCGELVPRSLPPSVQRAFTAR